MSSSAYHVFSILLLVSVLCAFTAVAKPPPPPTRLVILATTNIRGSVGKEARLGACTKELYTMFHIKIAGPTTSSPTTWVNLNEACLAEVVFSPTEVDRAKDDLMVTLEVRPNFMHTVSVELSRSATRVPVYAVDIQNGGLIEKQVHVFFEVETTSTASAQGSVVHSGNIGAVAIVWATLIAVVVFRQQIVDGIIFSFGSSRSSNTAAATGGVKRQVLVGSR